MKVNCICHDCVHCVNYRGTKRCNKRSFMINPKFIRAWGCNDYKCKYMSLLDIYEHANDIIVIKKGDNK